MVKTTFVVIFQIYEVMTTSCLFSYYTLVAYQNIIFFGQEAQKGNIFEI